MNFIEHEKDRKKPKKTLAEIEREARRLDLTYGQYMAYLETGYLETYIANRMKAHGEKVNMIASSIIGA